MPILRATAIHEAAHAVAAIRLGLVFDHVTAIADPDLELDGALHWTELHAIGGLEISPMVDAIVTLAGPFAEARAFNLALADVLADEPAGEDRETVAALGLTDDEFLAASRDTLALIDRDWPAIERIARELQSGRSLDFSQVEAVVNAYR